MIRIIRNLIPQDTRAVELLSAVTLISISILLFLGLINDHPLLYVRPIEFWILFSCIIGVLHLYSLLNCPNSELIRVMMCWLAGSLWLWVAFALPFEFATIVVFFLGFSNILAFIINTILLNKTWNSF